MKYLLFLGCLLSASFLSGQSTCLTSTELGISYPPINNVAERNFTLPHLQTLQCKKIRFEELWSFREPTKGNFTWSVLDDRLNWAFDNGIEVLLTIQAKGPAWACSGKQNATSCVLLDNQDFKNYIEILLQRYTTKIAKIQLGNEWQITDWYCGTAQDYIDVDTILYNAVKKYSPTTKVVLGGFTTSSLRYMAFCNGKVPSFREDDGQEYNSALICNSDLVVKTKNRIDSVMKYAKYDMLDLHLYDDVEQWDEYVYNFADTITKPIMVSEFGGPNFNYESRSFTYQATRIESYIQQLNAIGISEAYFFKLVEGSDNPAHKTSGLIYDTTYETKPAYDLFKSYSTCITSTKELESYSIVISPNPASNTITLRGISDLGELYVEMINANGITLNSCKVNINEGMNVGQYPPGLYWIKVRSGNYTSFQKLILE